MVVKPIKILIGKQRTNEKKGKKGGVEFRFYVDKTDRRLPVSNRIYTNDEGQQISSEMKFFRMVQIVLMKTPYPRENFESLISFGKKKDSSLFNYISRTAHVEKVTKSVMKTKKKNNKNLLSVLSVSSVFIVPLH